jgi:hypothetical protein
VLVDTTVSASSGNKLLHTGRGFFCGRLIVLERIRGAEEETDICVFKFDQADWALSSGEMADSFL